MFEFELRLDGYTTNKHIFLATAAFAHVQSIMQIIKYYTQVEQMVCIVMV
jgi:hypothetical protein